MTREQALRRSVLSCLLWEKSFYEDGQDIAQRITRLAAKVSPEMLAGLAIEARQRFHLRHVPLLLLTVLAKTGAGSALVADTVERVITRADEPGELISLYWKNGKKPLSAQLKKGLARAVTRFDAYELAKYNRDAAVKLRDVLFLVHAKPCNEEQEALWKRLIDGTLESPDTWEVALSAGADKRETWDRLLREDKLGYLALLRNLRNMTQAGVDTALIREAILARKGARRVLPFRYVAAARACPELEPALSGALSAAIAEMPVLSGTTAVLVDLSPSMYMANLSAKSDMLRADAAAALAGLVTGTKRVFTFSDQTVEVAPRLGLAGADAVLASKDAAQNRVGGTYLGRSLARINKETHDRLIVITDEQSHDEVPDPVAKRAYLINVATEKNGVGYGPRWVHIDGFSEAIFAFIREYEAAGA
jgi:hypothetical protein